MPWCGEARGVEKLKAQSWQQRKTASVKWKGGRIRRRHQRLCNDLRSCRRRGTRNLRRSLLDQNRAMQSLYNTFTNYVECWKKSYCFHNSICRKRKSGLVASLRRRGPSLVSKPSLTAHARRSFMLNNSTTEKPIACVKRGHNRRLLHCCTANMPFGRVRILLRHVVSETCARNGLSRLRLCYSNRVSSGR